MDAGPFAITAKYFTTVANATINKPEPSVRLGARVLSGILPKTTLFKDLGTNGSFPVNYMDLSAQNILINDNLTLLLSSTGSSPRLPYGRLATILCPFRC